MCNLFLRYLAPLALTLLMAGGDKSTAAQTATPAESHPAAEWQRLRSERDALFVQNQEAQAIIDDLRRSLDVLREEQRQLRAELARLRKTSSPTPTAVAEPDAPEPALPQIPEEPGASEAPGPLTADSAAAADLPPSDPRAELMAQRIETRYDPAADRTDDVLGPEPIAARGSAGDFHFSLVVSHPGRDLGEAMPSIKLFIQSDEATQSLANLETIEARVDDGIVWLPVAQVESTSRRGGLAGKIRHRRYRETVTVDLDRAMLGQLASAQTLELRAGRVTLDADDEDRAAFRAITPRLSQ